MRHRPLLILLIVFLFLVVCYNLLEIFSGVICHDGWKDSRYMKDTHICSWDFLSTHPFSTLLDSCKFFSCSIVLDFCVCKVLISKFYIFIPLYHYT